MAAIENLEIIVDVDIASALAALEDIQEELRDLAESIESVDAIGKEGIDIDVDLHDADRELAMLQARIQAFEAANSVDINTNFERGRFVIPNWRQSGQRAGNVGEMFDFLDLPGGREGRRSLFSKLRLQVSKLSDTFDDFDLRMSDMHNMLARLIPLLLVFIGVVPAAVTALVGLAAAAVAAAAALATIAGLGALGVGLVGGQFDMERLTEVWEEIRSDFIEAFAPLAERLQPIFEDAIDGLDRFFQAVANQGDALVALTDEARALGGFLMDFLPSALRTLAGIVEALSPLFADLGRWLNQNFNDIMADLVSVTAQAAPVIAELIIKLGKAIPFLVEMSIGFTMVASAVLDVLGLIGTLLEFLGINARAFGIVTAGVLAFASGLALANLVMGTFISEGIAAGVVALYNFWLGLLSANSALSYLASTTLISALSSLYSFIGSVIAGEVALFSFSAASFTAAGALAAFMTIATLGAAAALVGVAISAASSFLGLAGSIDSATSSLKDFNRVSGKTGTDGFNPYGAGTRGAGAADVGGTSGRSGEAGSTVINIESSGDRDDDKSNARYAGWRQGRTTGGDN